MGFTVKEGSEKGVLRRGSEKGVSRRCLVRPLVEYAPLGVRPRKSTHQFSGSPNPVLPFLGFEDQIFTPTPNPRIP